MGGWGLRLAIILAVGWAALVLGAFFTMIFLIAPFDDWSASQQMQLFQGMVGLAGFGAGGVALFFAAQQISAAFADPFLVLRFTARDPPGGFFLETEPRDDPRTFLTNGPLELLIDFEVTNKSVTICREWRVDVWAFGASKMDPSSGWQVTAETNHATRQAGEGEALYPYSPLPIGLLVVHFPSTAVRPHVIRLEATTLTERRRRLQKFEIRLL